MQFCKLFFVKIRHWTSLHELHHVCIRASVVYLWAMADTLALRGICLIDLLTQMLARLRLANLPVGKRLATFHLSSPSKSKRPNT